jgi:uncharacterized membrane protein
MNTIFGIFDDPAAARRALDALRASSLRLDDVSIVSRTSGGDITTHGDEDVSAGEGAMVGAVWGGLVGLTALLIPGLGPFIAGGALFATLTGAVTGAVVGGIAAALIDFSGIPEADARGYEDMIKAGKTLVAVRVPAEDADEVRRILTTAGATGVRGDQAAGTAVPAGPVHVAMYDEQGNRLMQSRELGGAGMPSRPGVYDVSETADARTGMGVQSWTSGEVVGEGQGAGPRGDTGAYDATQWAGEGRNPGKAPGAKWTSGEVVGEGQGAGPRGDTGAYDARQWVGEGQGDDRPADREEER